jgi:hypothetical protein
MKKSDLTRRAKDAADRLYDSGNPSQAGQNQSLGFVDGFESGYRAARADLRQNLSIRGRESLLSADAFTRFVIRWLRPIR